MKIFDSELRILEILWEKGDTTAKAIAEALRDKIGWSKTTTYTVIKKCLDKKAISRKDPGFICHVLVTKEKVQEAETTILIDKMFGGMPDQLVLSVLERKKLSAKDIKRLKDLIKDLS